MINFQKDAEQMKALAAYVSELTKQGVTFEIQDREEFVTVTLTGGF